MICIYICIHIHIYIYYIHVYIYVYIYIYIYILYTCIYIYVYIYISTIYIYIYMRICIILMCSKIFKQAMFRSVAAQKDSLNLPVKMKWNDPAIHPAANTKINTSSISAVWSAANPSGWWVSGLVKRPWRLQILAGVMYIYIDIIYIYIHIIYTHTYHV